MKKNGKKMCHTFDTASNQHYTNKIHIEKKILYHKVLTSLLWICFPYFGAPSGNYCHDRSENIGHKRSLKYAFKATHKLKRIKKQRQKNTKREEIEQKHKTNFSRSFCEHMFIYFRQNFILFLSDLLSLYGQATERY